MKLLILLAIVGLAIATDPTCPEFGDFRHPFGECLWIRGEDGKLSKKSMMEGFIHACDITVDHPENIPQLPPTLNVEVPEKCGHCSFKMRCKNRPMSDGCFPVQAEKQVCEEFGDVCMMPKTPLFKNCQWNMLGAMLTQCTTNRPDLPDWKRDGFRKGAEFFPEQNCIEKGEQCACCCHPFEPNEDGTACVKVPDEPADCPAFSEWNNWSECLWYPLEDMAKKVKQHCDIGGDVPSMNQTTLPTPAGFVIPEPCGYCAFKMRCKKRAASETERPGCFPVIADKKSCGPDDCPTCGNVCTLPQLPENPEAERGKCDWHKMLVQVLKTRAGAYLGKMKNYWRKRGFMHVIKYLPTGTCIEQGDKCKCCCHPYQPSADGTQCVLKDMCKLPSDLGITWGTKST